MGCPRRVVSLILSQHDNPPAHSSRSEPLLGKPHNPPRRQLRSHPYAENKTQRQSKRKQRPPPLNLEGISSKHCREAPPPKRRRPSFFVSRDMPQDSALEKVQPLQHPVDAEIRSRLLPSAMPAEGPGSGLKRRMSLRNILNLPKHARSVSRSVKTL